MSTIALEGVGARIKFYSSNLTSDLITLSLPERAREAISTTHLGTKVAKTSKPGKLIDAGQISAEFDHDPDAPVLLKQDPETIAIHYPLEEGQDNPARLSFKGFVVSEGGEEFNVDTRMTTKVTIQVISDYSYTPATLLP